MKFSHSRPRTPFTPKTALECENSAPVLLRVALQGPRTPEENLECETTRNITGILALQNSRFYPYGGIAPGVRPPTGTDPRWSKITFLQMDGRPSAIQCGANGTVTWIKERQVGFNPIHTPWLHRAVGFGRWALASSAIAGSTMSLERIGQGDGDGRSREYLGALGLVDPRLYVVLATIHYQQSFCVLTKPSCLAVNSGRRSHKASRKRAACLADHCPSRRKMTAHASNLAHSRSPLTSLVRSDPKQAADPLSKDQSKNARGSRIKATSRRFSPAIPTLIPLSHPHYGMEQAYQATNARNQMPYRSERPMNERFPLIGGVRHRGTPLFRRSTSASSTYARPGFNFLNIFSVSENPQPQRKGGVMPDDNALSVIEENNRRAEERALAGLKAAGDALLKSPRSPLAKKRYRDATEKLKDVRLFNEQRLEHYYVSKP